MDKVTPEQKQKSTHLAWILAAGAILLYLLGFLFNR
jgi:hypothetical protein